MEKVRLAICLALLCACVHPPSAPTPVPGVSLTPLREGVYMHRSWKQLPEGLFSANGLLVAHGAQALLVDTAWTAQQTEELYAQALAKGLTIVAVVVTHAHDDRVAGLDVLARHGVASYGLGLTQTEARAHQLPAPEHALADEGALTLAGSEVQTFYPGPAHATDNIVVYFPAQHLLFGGCMVRAAEWGLGPFGEASLIPWRTAIERVDARFPDATELIPGHGEPGGRALLAHTRELLNAQLGEVSGKPGGG